MLLPVALAEKLQATSCRALQHRFLIAHQLHGSAMGALQSYL